jgi:hypothetical protein
MRGPPRSPGSSARRIDPQNPGACAGHAWRLSEPTWSPRADAEAGVPASARATTIRTTLRSARIAAVSQGRRYDDQHAAERRRSISRYCSVVRANSSPLPQSSTTP